MNILITGGTGLLGKYLIAAKSAHHVRGVYLGKYVKKNNNGVEYINIDISSDDFEETALKDFSPDVIIHTAGIGNVDYCESHPEEAYNSIVKATEKMVVIANKCKSHLVFTSSNAVYDGENPPYSEEDKLNPLSMYGKLKVQAEKIVKDNSTEWSIVRPILMYGWNNLEERTNPVTWLIDKLSKNEKVNIVDDIFENPLYAGNAAEMVWKIVDIKAKGIFNLAGGEIVNRYQLAIATAEIFGLNKDLVKPVETSFFGSLFPRPKNTSFNTSKVEEKLHIRPLIVSEGLSLMKREAR